MNPFTDSTVARPLDPAALEQAGPASSRHAKKKRPFWRPAWCAIGLAGSLAISAPSFAIDVNVATQAQLEAVRGIGPKTAKIILEERSRGGKYESFDDLAERVKGIGAKKAATLQASGLTVGGGALAAAAAPANSAASAAQSPAAGAAVKSRGAPPRGLAK